MSNGNQHKRVDKSERRSVAGVIVAGVAVLVLVGGAASGIVFALKGDEPPPTGAVGASATPTPSVGDVPEESVGDVKEEPDPVSDTARSSCVAELESAEGVASAARTGIRHLKKHVDAHQAWIDGRISEEKKSAQYKRTRLLGPGDIDRYQDAKASYTNLKADVGGECASVGKACRRRMRTITASIDAAELGMSHWEAHLTNMADFAAGKFDATTANEKWNQTRAQLPAMTKPWDDAKRALDRAPSCT